MDLVLLSALQIDRQSCNICSLNMCEYFLCFLVLLVDSNFIEIRQRGYMHLRTMTITLTTTISSAVARTEIIMNAFCILGTLKYFVMYKEGIQFGFFFYRSIVWLCDDCIYAYMYQNVCSISILRKSLNSCISHVLKLHMTSKDTHVSQN